MQIESCEFYQTLNANILGVRHLNLKYFFPEMINYYSLIVNAFLSHCHNFMFSYFFPNFALLDHSVVVRAHDSCVEGLRFEPDSRL